MEMAENIIMKTVPRSQCMTARLCRYLNPIIPLRTGDLAHVVNRPSNEISSLLYQAWQRGKIKRIVLKVRRNAKRLSKIYWASYE